MRPEEKHQQYLDAFYTLATEEPETLQGVYERVVDGCRQALTLVFDRKCLVFSANPDNDTLAVHCEDTGPLDPAVWARIDSVEHWSVLIGNAFGWGWITINQQGYCDGMLVSFDGILPNVLLCVSGSSIAVSQIIHQEKTDYVHPR
jgi:hypothetical protein